MGFTPPTEINRENAILGVVKINHGKRGYSYNYYLGEGADPNSKVLTLAAICDKLQYIIPIGSEIFDAVVYQPDVARYAISAITKSRPSLSTKIVTPGGGPPDVGFVPNDSRTCLHFDITGRSWKGREFFRTPPDSLISDGLWVGNNFGIIQSGSAAATFTPNPSTAEGAVAGTFEERVYDYYRYIFNELKFEWRDKVLSDGSTDPNVIEISEIRYINFKRVTSHKMGRAFLP